MTSNNCVIKRMCLEEPITSIISAADIAQYKQQHLIRMNSEYNKEKVGNLTLILIFCNSIHTLGDILMLEIILVIKIMGKTLVVVFFKKSDNSYNQN